MNRNIGHVPADFELDGEVTHTHVATLVSTGEHIALYSARQNGVSVHTVLSAQEVSDSAAYARAYRTAGLTLEPAHLNSLATWEAMAARGAHAADPVITYDTGGRHHVLMISQPDYASRPLLTGERAENDRHPECHLIVLGADPFGCDHGPGVSGIDEDGHPRVVQVCTLANVGWLVE